MLETTASQHSRQTNRSPKHEHTIKITVTCPICDAGYIPSAEHQNLLQAPPVALESAFMRMCHFCFRCRRPACPACWDNIHGVCGSCVQEAGLPFRAEAAPLKGLVFPPLPRGQSTQEDILSPQLVCIRPGRFQNDIAVETTPVKEKRSNGVPSSSIVGVGLVPSLSSPVPILSEGAGTSPTQSEDKDKHIKLFVHFMQLVERIVTVILLIVLLAIVGLVLLAEVSLPANAQIMRLLHVDIRYEIAYLLYLVRQIHW